MASELPMYGVVVKTLTVVNGSCILVESPLILSPRSSELGIYA